MAEPLKAPTLGQARIAGRIDSATSHKGQHGTTWRTLLKLPSVDQYTSPSTVEVRSGERLGPPGQEVSLIVAVGGFSKSYRTKDGDERRTADNVLNFVAFA